MKDEKYTKYFLQNEFYRGQFLILSKSLYIVAMKSDSEYNCKFLIIMFFCLFIVYTRVCQQRQTKTTD